ncbi:hypothetical protein RV134_130008 [Roseovarius sp. EC-HK134]|nr:hypothetical protein RV134_130008 [Roseovarius sp. EC-HK134]VVT34038.1 hypothetical protein RV420_90005 [Roseovarius sp. EC-SD190]
MLMRFADLSSAPFCFLLHCPRLLLGYRRGREQDTKCPLIQTLRVCVGGGDWRFPSTPNLSAAPNGDLSFTRNDDFPQPGPQRHGGNRLPRGRADRGPPHRVGLRLRGAGRCRSH